MTTPATANPASARATVSTPPHREIHIERVFKAHRDRVWRAMTEPELLAQWWGRGNMVRIETYEFRKGGHWRFVEKADGQEHGFEGRFRDIQPPSKLSMTFEWDGLPGYPLINTMELVDLGDNRTKLIATSHFFHKDERDGMMAAGMEGGMNESYAALDRLLATMSS
jgi:uncharacterized protein YndB with AHSA1/START domain